jgi:quinol monooxygenase YgiN
MTETTTTTTTGGYVTVLWDAKAKAGREAELRAFITAAVTPSRSDDGNIDYEAHEVEGQPGAFVIYERWESRAHLDAHLRGLAPEANPGGGFTQSPPTRSTRPVGGLVPRSRHARSAAHPC